MTEPSPAVTAGGLVRRWERLTHATHQFLLPAAAAAGLSLGGALALGAPRALEAYAPLALVVVGGGALGSSLVYLRWRGHAAAARAVPVRVPAAVPTAPCPRCAESDARHEWSEIVRRAWHTPIAGPPHGSMAAGYSSPTPGQQIWDTWGPQSTAGLPVPLVGPVPETAWIQPPPGAHVPFPHKEPSLIVVNGALTPIVSAVSGDVPNPSTPNPASPADALPAPVPSMPAHSPELDTTFLDLARFAELGLGPFDPSLDWLVLEALHPLPPYLRSTAEATCAARAEATSLSTDIVIEETCGSCTQTIPEDAGGGACPECGVPVCHSCRARAIVEFGHTWCLLCGVGRAWALPSAAPVAAEVDTGMVGPSFHGPGAF
ncbi:MAG: hypothetical protein L3K18_03030 [Thermoplasmata archaeon]|nr:hypothetical protein [Thermoplasmata archaeon]MCI4356105.1 hypothetical protein [Thermoplasmata archaeon]